MCLQGKLGLSVLKIKTNKAKTMISAAGRLKILSYWVILKLCKYLIQKLTKSLGYQTQVCLPYMFHINLAKTVRKFMFGR